MDNFPLNCFFGGKTFNFTILFPPFPDRREIVLTAGVAEGVDGVEEAPPVLFLDINVISW